MCGTLFCVPWQDVQGEHAVSIARAVVDYELKDPEGRRVLGIEPGHLAAGPRYREIAPGSMSPENTQHARRVNLSYAQRQRTL